MLGRDYDERARAILNTGTIRWYTPEKCFGFIDARDSDRCLFFLARHAPAVDPSSLRPGLPVTFEPYEGPKGLEAHAIRVLGAPGNGSALEARCGFSECRFEPETRRLIARGWFLGPAVEAVEICDGSGELIGHAKTGLPRSDVYQQYPEYGNPDSGWRFECSSADSVPDRIDAVVVVGGVAHTRMRKEVELDDGRD